MNIPPATIEVDAHLLVLGHLHTLISMDENIAYPTDFVMSASNAVKKFGLLVSRVGAQEVIHSVAC